MKFILTPLPISVNHLYKITCSRGYPNVYMTKEAKELKESYGWQAKSQVKVFMPGLVEVDIVAYFGDKRKHDVDNVQKLVLDSLKGVIIEDDNLIKKISVTKEYDKQKPRLEVEINPYQSK
jgi:Holliday junction resolvase RusA-like endonuclease